MEPRGSRASPQARTVRGRPGDSVSPVDTATEAKAAAREATARAKWSEHNYSVGAVRARLADEAPRMVNKALRVRANTVLATIRRQRVSSVSVTIANPNQELKQLLSVRCSPETPLLVVLSFAHSAS